MYILFANRPHQEDVVYELIVKTPLISPYDFRAFVNDAAAVQAKVFLDRQRDERIRVTHRVAVAVAIGNGAVSQIDTVHLQVLLFETLIQNADRGKIQFISARQIEYTIVILFDNIGKDLDDRADLILINGTIEKFYLKTF